jgi:hypothetical protein
MMVTPVSRSERTIRHMSCLSSTSTPAVGSSRNRIRGSCDSALAMRTRRFMPPERVMILLSFLSHKERSFSTFSMWPGFGRLPNSPRLKLTVAQTVSNASVVSSCGTRPMSERAAR